MIAHILCPAISVMLRRGVCEADEGRCVCEAFRGGWGRNCSRTPPTFAVHPSGLMSDWLICLEPPALAYLLFLYGLS